MYNFDRTTRTTKLDRARFLVSATFAITKKRIPKWNATQLHFAFTCKKVPLICLGHDGNANSRSEIFVRQIGHSEQAREQDLHTVKRSIFFTFQIIIFFLRKRVSWR